MGAGFFAVFPTIGLLCYSILMRYLISALLLTSVTIITTPRVFAEDSDKAVIQSCLEHWGKHPFDAKNPKYRIISSRVKVFGIGQDIEDKKKTSKPELVLVKHNVAVLSKSRIGLLNPNGWYCLKGDTAVLGKSEVVLDCKANLATSGEGVTVLGSNSSDDGVTVLGSSSVRKVGCSENSDSESEADAKPKDKPESQATQ